MDDFKEHLSKLVELHGTGKLQCIVDRGEQANTGPFGNGVDSVVDAIEVRNGHHSFWCGLKHFCSIFVQKLY